MNKEYKILLTGDVGVGKTSFLIRTTENSFSEEIKSTIGLDFRSKIVQTGGEQVTLHIWDTSGQERYRNMTSSYYRGADVILIMYDVTNMESFINVKQWIQDIDRYASENVLRILIGNKCDRLSQKVVDSIAAKEYADHIGIPFIEISCKVSLNIDELNLNIVNSLLPQSYHYSKSVNPKTKRSKTLKSCNIL